MQRQRHETRLDAPITSVFSALIDVVARGRWGAARIVLDAPQPRPGCEYAQQRRTVLRRGKVLECLRPVKLTLEETLLDRPCRVQLRLTWRLEPVTAAKARITAIGRSRAGIYAATADGYLLLRR